MTFRMALLAAVMALLLGCQPRGVAETPVANAVRANDVDALRAYLDQGGDIDATSRDGHSLLYLASGPRGGVEVLAVLLSGGADVEKGSAEGRTPLMNAAGWCDAERVLMLLGAGADPRRTAQDGSSARDAVCAGPLDSRQRVLDILDAAP